MGYILKYPKVPNYASQGNVDMSAILADHATDQVAAQLLPLSYL